MEEAFKEGQGPHRGVETVMMMMNKQNVKCLSNICGNITRQLPSNVMYTTTQNCILVLIKRVH
jgi:hypothetical protein